MDSAPPAYEDATKQPAYNTQYNQQQDYPAPGYPQAMPQMGQPQPQMQYQQTHTTIIVNTPQFGPHPVSMQCNRCHASIVTNVRHESGACAWLSCFLCCIVGCDAGCCLIPFCVDDCQDVIHSCPNCNQRIGTYKRL